MVMCWVRAERRRRLSQGHSKPHETPSLLLLHSFTFTRTLLLLLLLILHHHHHITTTTTTPSLLQPLLPTLALVDIYVKLAVVVTVVIRCLLWELFMIINSMTVNISS